jgi:hypothetical protein
MTRDDLTHPVFAAATTPVKLCPYNKGEPHIWFRLIKAQFAAAGIRSQKLKYANALANLPKQVLRDILDTLNVCNDSDEPFDCLKYALLGQFGKSKWQSYFELLCLPMKMQGLKPSFLLGKLKQRLPPGVSPDTDLFLAMFLIRLPPSMREAVGACNHKTAPAMAKAADAQWMLQAATALRSQPPRLSEEGALLLTTGSEATNRAATPAPKVTPLPALTFTLFKSLAMAFVNFTIIMPTRLTGVFQPVLGWETKLPWNPFWFGGHSYTCHCHGYAFSSQCRIDFSYR